MQEDNTQKLLKASYFYFQPIKIVAEEIQRTINQTEAEKVLRLKAKDFGKEPRFLISLLKTAENFPHLKAAIDSTNLIETQSLDVLAAEQALQAESSEIFRELKNVVAHRKRLTLKKSRNVSDDSPFATVVRLNPKKHEKDSIEDLTKYLINNPESGFYFLRQEKRQLELVEKPLLIAKMIAGDSNLHQTILKEGICLLKDIPAPIQRALSVFSEVVILLSTPQLKSNAVIHSQFIEDLKLITTTSIDDIFPEEKIRLLYKDVKNSVIKAIETMLAKLPENKETLLLQKHLQVLHQTQDSLPPKIFNEEALKLYEEVKDTVTQLDDLMKVHAFVKNPLLQASKRFQQLLPELVKLNERSTSQEIVPYLKELNDIQDKNTRRRMMDDLIEGLEKEKPELAKRFRDLASDFNENSEKSPMDKFIQELKTVKGNLNALNQAHVDLDDPLLKDNPMLDSLRNQLKELTIYSRKFEFENFQKALREARKRANDTKKQRSSMEKPEALPEDLEDSTLTSSFSELEIYKGSPPKSPRSTH